MSSYNKPKFSVEQGAELRKQGKTYKEIAAILGCSEVWCKKNLKDVEVINPDSDLINECFKEAMSPDGITGATIAYLVKGRYPTETEEFLQEKVAMVKKAIKRKDDDAVIRPRWMLPECPQDCANAMNDMADYLHEKMQSLAEDYRRLFDLDATYQAGIVYELSRLSAPRNSMLLPQGFAKRGEQLGKIIHELDKRNKND